MKNNYKIFFSSAFAVCALLVSVNMATPAQSQNAPSSDANLLSSLKNGLWQFKEPARGNGVVDAICVGDVTKFVKIKNKNDVCTLKMLRSEANSVTYDYSCSGKGKGRTMIRKETNGLVQIHSQGIANGELFDFKLEARHTGSCK